MLESLAHTIVDSAIHHWVISIAWLWPTMEIIHFIGLSLLFGGLIVLDLRLAGHLRSLDPAKAHQLLPWVSLGFGLNLATGILFFCGDPLRYAVNIGFQVKMILVLVAGLNALLYVIKLRPLVLTWGPESAPPPLAKFVAYASLATWTGVLVCGRLIPYVGTG